MQHKNFHKKFRSSIINSTLARAKTCPTAFRGANCRLRNMESEKSNILVMDGHFVTREPIKVQKTETTQNDPNFIGISNFSSKNFFASHGQSAAQGHIVLGLGLLARPKF